MPHHMFCPRNKNNIPDYGTRCNDRYDQHWFIDSYIAPYVQVLYKVTGVHPTGLTIARGVGRCPQDFQNQRYINSYTFMSVDVLISESTGTRDAGTLLSSVNSTRVYSRLRDSSRVDRKLCGWL